MTAAPAEVTRPQYSIDELTIHTGRGQLAWQPTGDIVEHRALRSTAAILIQLGVDHEPIDIVTAELHYTDELAALDAAIAALQGDAQRSGGHLPRRTAVGRVLPNHRRLGPMHPQSRPRRRPRVPDRGGRSSLAPGYLARGYGMTTPARDNGAEADSQATVEPPGITEPSATCNALGVKLSDVVELRE